VIGGVLAPSDALVRDGSGWLEFVPGRLRGDDPEEVKRGYIHVPKW
jgi:hypothetical protein